MDTGKDWQPTMRQYIDARVAASVTPGRHGSRIQNADSAEPSFAPTTQANGPVNSTLESGKADGLRLAATMETLSPVSPL